MATFLFNFNTLLLQQQQPPPHLNLTSLPLYPFHHSYLSLSLSLNVKTTFQPHHYALTPHASSIKTTISERVKKNIEHLVEKKNKSNKMRKDSPEMRLRVAFDMCSKKGDAIGALSLYDLTKKEGVVKLGQHHYTVLLYLCSSAAFGVVKPAKSGSGARTLNALVSPCSEVLNHEEQSRTVDRNNTSFSNVTFDNAEELNSLSNSNEELEKREEDNPFDQEENGTLKSEDVKKYALQRGFEVYENMCLDKVQMNEAALTSVARMAMSMGDGDMAFEMVKQMKNLGISPRLRSYGPALWTFCNNGEIDKAFEVEKHMLENGVYPEEPELEALLRVSVGASKGDKVYYVLHKLRSCVRKVSLSTASLIIDWFKCKHATRIGKRKWDKRLMKEVMENNGGGWHGQGWLGRGKWGISDTTIGNNGICKCCGVHLTTIDLDLIETENFAKSVASFAIMREKKSNFEKFQKWLDSYGPFDAVVDAANVGLFGQRINAVVNGIREKLHSKKLPLIILHNKRIKGEKVDQPINKALIDRWNNADALYATPTGSNDDWYWLYAAIKFKCLIVTNDEMRDHLFQLLGNDFFPKWKERHQVHFSFTDTGPEFHMPPPCSVVIQESEEGHWHIPIESEHNYESERRWLCVTRDKAGMVGQDFSISEGKC
ncbi:hypothetical protein TanjilG_21025 [Lupinus angustifolius]|uniref:ribonuclease P n=1 Tax=Lupinus angustifolius TaxID=3871 RepID=A0A1J7GTP0_LUPAN|nr:hypothetical protein TanjilG_21025 [Lupinus angustifolius]